MKLSTRELAYLKRVAKEKIEVICSQGLVTPLHEDGKTSKYAANLKNKGLLDFVDIIADSDIKEVRLTNMGENIVNK